MNQSIKSRLAPTPSGFLHIGNAYNFLITYRETVLKRQGVLSLRIDDSDSTRIKDEYIEDIFETLAWLKIPYTVGPRSLSDFKTNFSQGLKTHKYSKFLKNIPNTYVCECSRSTLKKFACSCFSKKLTYIPNENTIKLKVQDQELKDDIGDIVLWRKEDLPAYQLTSLADDIEGKINLIIRGDDLRSSSRVQFLIAESINNKSFTQAVFLHHPLIQDHTNTKISKSQLAVDDNSLILREWRNLKKNRNDVLKYLGFNDWEHFIDS